MAVLAGELPDRVPYVENGIDFPFMCRLLERELPFGKYFDSGEYQTPPMDYQLETNRLLHRDNVKFDLQPPIPAHKIPGANQILFYHDGYVKTWDDLERLQFPDLGDPSLRHEIAEFLAQKGDYATIMATRVGISATYLAMGMEHFYVTLLDDRDLVEEVFRRYTDWTAQAVYLAAEMGFDIFWTSDDIAAKNGPLWSPELFHEVFWPHAQKVANAVRDVGIKWIFHSDGDLWKVLPELVGLGITGLNPIEPACMDIGEVRNAFPELVLVGNVDVDLLTRGTPDKVREAVRMLMRDVAPHGRFLAASGNSLASYCDVDNVMAMTDAIVELGSYSKGA